MALKTIFEPVLILNRFFLAVQISNVQNSIGALVTGKAKVVTEEYQQFSITEWSSYTKQNLNNPEIMLKYKSLIRSPSISIFTPQVLIFPACEYTNPLVRGVRYSRKSLFQRDNFTCQYCGVKFSAKDLNIDHVIPRSKGGSNSWENIVTSCKSCNSKKADYLLVELKWKLLKNPKQPRWRSHLWSKSQKTKKKIYWEKFLK